MTASGKSASSHYVEVNGQRLHYKQWSDSGPPLLLLHGVTSSSAGWDFIAPRLASQYAVMAFDLRGHGLSSKPDTGYTWTNHYAADITEFVQRHLHQPAILIGHSLGAMLTVPVAVNAPNHVRAIVMEDPPAFRHSGPGENTTPEFRTALDLKCLPYEQRVQEMMKVWRLNEGAAARRSDELEAMAEPVLVELIQGGTAYQPEDWFPRLPCPALVILGNPDRGGAVAHNDRPRLRSLLSNATIQEWDDVGHLIHFQKMERFLQEVTSFLNNLP